MTREPIPVLAQDPRFGGGVRALTEAFWRAAAALGEEPHLHYASRAEGISPRFRPRLRTRYEEHPPLRGTAYPSFLPELDAINQRVNAVRIGSHIGSAPHAWVVAASAPYGAAAPRAGRPYGCWLATGLESEWASRRASLTPTRRLAFAASRRELLRLEREVLRSASFVCGISPASRQSLAEAGDLPLESVGLLPIAVDTDAFRPLPDDQWQAGLERPLVVFVGRASDPRKNVGLLVDAFAQLRVSHPDARLRFVGQPPPAALVRGAAGIETTGTVASVADAVRDAAVLVLPSLQEGFGIVVAEAFASGVPAVVTPCGGPEELVVASGGGVVLSGFTCEELAGTLARLLANRPRLDELRRRGREYVVREHSPERLQTLLAERRDELAR